MGDNAPETSLPFAQPFLRVARDFSVVNLPLKEVVRGHDPDTSLCVSVVQPLLLANLELRALPWFVIEPVESLVIRYYFSSHKKVREPCPISKPRHLYITQITILCLDVQQVLRVPNLHGSSMKNIEILLPNRRTVHCISTPKRFNSAGGSNGRITSSIISSDVCPSSSLNVRLLPSGTILPGCSSTPFLIRPYIFGPSSLATRAMSKITSDGKLRPMKCRNLPYQSTGSTIKSSKVTTCDRSARSSVKSRYRTVVHLLMNPRFCWKYWSTEGCACWNPRVCFTEWK